MKFPVSAALYAGSLLGLLLPGTLSALSLGEAQLQSRYGQPLQLRLPVELGSEDEQADAGLVQARLLGHDYYEAQGVAVPELAPSEFSVRTEQDQGRTWAVITTSRALREPMLTLFVSVRLGPSRIIREVPVLLDFQQPAAVRPAPAAIPIPEVSQPLAAPLPAVASQAVAITADAEPAPAVPAPRKRRRSRPAGEALPDAAAQPAATTGLRMETALSRPDGYSRFRLDESFSSFRQALPAAAPVAVAEPPAAAEVIEAAASAEAVTSAEAAESGYSWWTYAWLLGLAAVFVGMVRRQRRARVPHLNIASLPGRYETHYGERAAAAETSMPPEPMPMQAAAEAAAVPAPQERPAESRPMQPAEPVASSLMIMDEAPPPPAAAAAMPREGYPNQELRDRVAQLAKLMTTASEKRKLELVKAYIDVERVDSAQKLLAELEEKQFGSSRPERLDFELV